MKDLKNVCGFDELHKQMISMIIEERNQEMAASIAQKRLEAEMAQARLQEEIEAIEAAGLKISKLHALDLAAREEEELASIEAQMAAESEESASTLQDLHVDTGLLPSGACLLTPSWAGAFSDDDVQDKLTEASIITSQTYLKGGGCKNYYNWARGAGSGIAGSGVGRIQSWIDFGFWFRPPTSRFYSIRPCFRLRGYYIVKANDKWYNSKYARVKITTWVNVYQYNWKGWNSETILNVGDDNINVNKRFDVDRHMYTSYLLGGGDWAYIRCTIGLYAYARGSGSYAKNDFATGNANYLCVPCCYVY